MRHPLKGLFLDGALVKELELKVVLEKLDLYGQVIFFDLKLVGNVLPNFSIKVVCLSSLVLFVDSEARIV